MQVNWREIPAARNSYAVLGAACGSTGWNLLPVTQPEADITCYSLNSINERRYRDEIAAADCITLTGGPHATACWREVAAYADYVIVGEGEYALPSLLADLEAGRSGHIPGVATRDGYKPVKSSVRLDAYPAFSDVKGYVEISRGCPFACGYARPRRSSDTACGTGQLMRSQSMPTGMVRQGLSAPMRSPTVPTGSIPASTRSNISCANLPTRSSSGHSRARSGPSSSVKSLLHSSPVTAPTQNCTSAPNQEAMLFSPAHRGHTAAEAIRAAELCSGAGITPVIDFIVGFPFETDEDQEATVAAIQELSRIGKIHVHQFIPLPVDPLCKNPCASAPPRDRKSLRGSRSRR